MSTQSSTATFDSCSATCATNCTPFAQTQPATNASTDLVALALQIKNQADQQTANDVKQLVVCTAEQSCPGVSGSRQCGYFHPSTGAVTFCCPSDRVCGFGTCELLGWQNVFPGMCINWPQIMPMAAHSSVEQAVTEFKLITGHTKLPDTSVCSSSGCLADPMLQNCQVKINGHPIVGGEMCCPVDTVCGLFKCEPIGFGSGGVGKCVAFTEPHAVTVPIQDADSSSPALTIALAILAGVLALVVAVLIFLRCRQAPVPPKQELYYPQVAPRHTSGPLRDESSYTHTESYTNETDVYSDWRMDQPYQP